MAVRELNITLVRNADAARDTTQLANPFFHAGAPVAVDATTKLLKAADRAVDAAASYRGVAYDDHSRGGNTRIDVDPVGSSYLDAQGNLVANNNALMALPTNRKIADFQDELISGVTNYTAGASGYEGPKRPCAVIMAPGQIGTDQFSLKLSAGATADTTTGFTTFAANDLLTYGAGAAAGTFVKLATTTDGRAIAVVDSFDAAGNMLYITLL